MEPTTVVTVHVDPVPEDDGGELDRLTRQLRSELLRTDAERVDLETGPVPAGAKGLGALASGGLVVELARTADLLRAVVGTITGWLARHTAHTVRIQQDGDVLELTGVTSSDQHALVEAWISRHAGPLAASAT